MSRSATRLGVLLARVLRGRLRPGWLHWLVGLNGALLLVACGRPVDPGPPEVVKVAAHGPQLSIVSVGDILLADASASALKLNGYDWPFDQVKPLLDHADLVMGNLEGPITTAKERLSRVKKYSYKVRPIAAQALQRAGFGALSLANNHTLDYGIAGMNDTLEAVRKAGMRPFGAGKHEAEARRGLVYDFGTVRVGILGYADTWGLERGLGWYAGGDDPGCARLDEKTAAADIARMRRYADFVVVSVHWGQNYKPVTASQRRMGKRLIDLGADLVNGHHPHIAQGIEIYKGKPILYSVGNFVFGTPGRYKRGEQGYGLVARWLLEGSSLRWILATPIAVNNKQVKFQPRRVSGEEAKRAIDPLLEHNGTSARWQDDTAFIGFQPGWQEGALPELPWRREGTAAAAAAAPAGLPGADGSSVEAGVSRRDDLTPEGAGYDGSTKEGQESNSADGAPPVGSEPAGEE